MNLHVGQDKMGTVPSSKSNVTYYVVPSLKSIVTHKIISFIYEDNLTLDLKLLDNDILEFMISKMPFSVIYRIYELKLAGDVIGDPFLKAYAESKQFEEETRNMIVKLLKIKSETKIGLWTAFRRECLRSPHSTCLFWEEFVKRERHITESGENGSNVQFTKQHSQSRKIKDFEKARGVISTLKRDIGEYMKLLTSLAEVFSLNSILK